MSNTPSVSEAIEPRSRGQFWEEPEQYLLDAGNEGERVIARVRMALVAVLLLVPLTNLLLAAATARSQHLAGLFVTLGAFGPSAGIYYMVQRDQRQRWLPLATSLFDVTLVTLAQIIFAYIDDPQVVVNSKITFDTYFIVLAGTCLRYDKRIALVAGLVCIAQFAATILFVSTNFPINTAEGVSLYGRFQWSDQISRGILLAATVALNVLIVERMQLQRRLSTADPLTGTFNRRFFDDYLQNELARVSRYGSALAVAMIDVDHFKEFNDRFGHAAGDQALRQVARALQLAVRRSDLVARYGGEEFVVLLRESSAQRALERVEEIREAIAREPLLPQLKDPVGDPVYVTVSIGVASWPADGRTATALLAEADRRLFVAKNAGRNRVVGAGDGREAIGRS